MITKSTSTLHHYDLVLSTEIEGHHTHITTYPDTLDGNYLADLHEAYLQRLLHKVVAQARAYTARLPRLIKPKKPRKDPALRGVSKIRSKYQVHRNIEGQTMYLGTYDTQEDAQAVYQESLITFPKGSPIKMTHKERYALWLNTPF